MSARQLDFDVGVIGGGIHGVGVAQAAAARGWRTALFEERALARGTSSRSSKLIHGGLRYLEHGELGLVRESLAERALLVRLAPELVKLVAFYIPVYRGMRRRAWQIRAGLSLYATLGGLVRDARFARVPRNTWHELDGLATDGLQNVFRYFDGQTDDARLVRAVAASARELGATFFVPSEFLGANRSDFGWRARFRDANGERELAFGALVNAAGPWAASVQSRFKPSIAAPPIELVAGTHVELEGALERGIYYTEAPRDGRAVFSMPWKGHTLVGTTERAYSGDPAAIEPTDDEIAYLLETFHRAFPKRPTRVLGSWAGLRVLPSSSKRAFERAREVQFTFDDAERPRQIAIFGGKLTGYRATAAKVIGFLERSLPNVEARARTDELRLAPAD